MVTQNKVDLMSLLPYAALAAVGFYLYSQYQKSPGEAECIADGGRWELIRDVTHPEEIKLVGRCVMPGVDYGPAAL